MFDFDLFVIGAGSGGVRAARIAAGFGAKVAIAEEHRIGGTCVIRGCIPKKLFVQASHYAADFEDAVGFGWQQIKPEFSWKTLVANKDKEIDRLNGLYIQTLQKATVQIFECRAVLKDAHTLELADGKTLTAETILIATGGHPYLPDLPGIEHAISSSEAFYLVDFPKRVVISGAGYIAVEFAGIFNGLGADVTVAYRRDKVLRGFDEDVRDHLTRHMAQDGIKFRFETVISSIEKVSGGLEVTYDNGDVELADQVMFATGRVPNTDGLGLSEAGVQLAANGAVIVDDYSRSNLDSIFAVGDVTDRIQLTPVAIREGHAFALTQYGDVPVSPEHDNVPSAVFSNPPIGSVGLTESAAREKYQNIDVYKSEFRPLKHTLSGRDERSLTKLLVEADSDRVVGAHMIGPDAPEIIQGIAIAVKKGLTKADFDATLAIHPSSAEEFVLMREKS